METKLKWHQKKWATVLLLILFFPVGLWFMWKNKHWNKPVRWAITIIIIGYGVINADFSKVGNRDLGYCGYCQKEVGKASKTRVYDNIYGTNTIYCNDTHRNGDRARVKSQVESDATRKVARKILD